MPARQPACRAVACVLAIAAFAGCASTPGADPQSLKEADAPYLNRECKLLGTVSARSIFGGLSDEAKIQAAVKNVREKAAAMGATHVLMMKAEVSGVTTMGDATARAYRCDAKP